MNSAIYAINLDRESVKSLTDDPSDDYEPALSPDGSRIVYSSDFDIVVMNSDGTDQTNLTKSEAYDSTPTWFPDGRIVFESNGDILAMNADGTSQTNLTNNALFESQPTLSADGTRIAFIRATE